MTDKKDLNLDQIVRSIERVYPSTAEMIFRSFLHGLFTALGATVGLALVVSLITYLITRVNFIPKEYQQEIKQVLPEDR